MLWGDKPYYSLDFAMKQQYGAKIYKIALDGGMTCPNRDGTLGTKGCIFCSETGSGDFASPRCSSVTLQIENAINGVSKKVNAAGYIAYFQSFTNTYAPTEYLRELFFEAINHPQVKILSIATRPDCIPEDVLELICELNKIKPVWIELGLQTIHEATATWMRRGYKLDVFEDTVKRLKKRRITVIVHTILGLPGESEEEVLSTIDYLNCLRIDGIKLQLLHVLKNTDLAAEYEQGLYKALEFEEYIDLLINCLEHISPEIIIHRVTGDGPGDLMLAPMWSTKKRVVLNTLHSEMKKRESYQGKKFLISR